MASSGPNRKPVITRITSLGSYFRKDTAGIRMSATAAYAIAAIIARVTRRLVSYFFIRAASSKNKTPPTRKSGAAQALLHASSFIQTILSATEFHRICLSARGLYRRSGIAAARSSPCPEECGSYDPERKYITAGIQCQ